MAMSKPGEVGPYMVGPYMVFSSWWNDRDQRYSISVLAMVDTEDEAVKEADKQIRVHNLDEAFIAHVVRKLRRRYVVDNLAVP